MKIDCGSSVADPEGTGAPLTPVKLVKKDGHHTVSCTLRESSGPPQTNFWIHY